MAFSLHPSSEPPPHGHGSRPSPASDLERLVLRAARAIQPLATLAPVDAAAERMRLVRELKNGGPVLPRWRHVPAHHEELRPALDAAERHLEGCGGILGDLYLARVRELALEAAICSAAGTALVARLARDRFAYALPQHREAATRLCTSWLDERVEGDEDVTIPSDAPDPRSLLSQIRAEVSRRRLPFRVITSASLASLAATGDGVLYVATGRTLSPEEIRRTVLHEVEGHAAPRARAPYASCPLFAAGTARGVDDQEGRAILIEQRAGLLGPRRRRALAARYRAVEMMIGGADFGDVSRTLVRRHGLSEEEAVLVGERVFRGSSGTHPGLGRERVYLEAFVRVRACLAERPEDEDVLASGQVALGAVEALRPFVA